MTHENGKKLLNRLHQEEEYKQVKVYKQQKNHVDLDEVLEGEELDPDIYDFCRKHLK